MSLRTITLTATFDAPDQDVSVITATIIGQVSNLSTNPPVAWEAALVQEGDHRHGGQRAAAEAAAAALAAAAAAAATPAP